MSPGSVTYALFHRLWSKAVGTPTYVKEEWKLLDDAITGRPIEKCAGCGALFCTDRGHMCPATFETTPRMNGRVRVRREMHFSLTVGVADDGQTYAEVKVNIPGETNGCEILSQEPAPSLDRAVQMGLPKLLEACIKGAGTSSPLTRLAREAAAAGMCPDHRMDFSKAFVPVEPFTGEVLDLGKEMSAPPDQFFQNLATRALEYLKDGRKQDIEDLATELKEDTGWVSHSLGILQQRGVVVMCSESEDGAWTVWVQA